MDLAMVYDTRNARCAKRADTHTERQKMADDDKMQGNDISDQALEGVAGGATTPNLGYLCPQCGRRSLWKMHNVDPIVECLACGWYGLIDDVI